MGSCASKENYDSAPTQGMKLKTKGIEDRMQDQQDEERKTIRVLLLGAGECGKSTILKQMVIIHKKGFTEMEKLKYKDVAYTNTLESIQTLAQACKDLSIALESRENEERQAKILKIDKDSGQYHFDAREDIEILWKDSGIQDAFARASEFHLLDSAKYFLSPENTCRIFTHDFDPTDQDVLRCRLQTTGIVQTDFFIDKLNFKMYDVGGQRGERKKWIHSFDDVTAIMFIASLSEYDQKLAEDRTKNRLKESLDLFEGIINLPWFKEAPIILFLNKKDLFEEKIAKIDIGIYFPLYAGGCDYEAGLKFIQDHYFDRNQNPHKTIYCHVTDATNTDNIAFVWKSTKHIILERNLTKSGLAMC